MIEQIFLKELRLTKQVHQKSAIFVTIGIFLKGFSFNDMYAMAVMMYE